MFSKENVPALQQPSGFTADIPGGKEVGHENEQTDYDKGHVS
jgi:hypothetical protein